MRIRPITNSDLVAVQKFTDVAIGEGYYSAEDWKDILEKSSTGGQVFSLLLEDADHAVRGVRITYPAGRWDQGKGNGLRPDLWKAPLEKTAYFQSLFIDPSLIGQGWGTKMSLAALELLRQTDTNAVVCHSWKESPGGSSGRYLKSLGFELVATHPLYWKDVDYVCTRCGKDCLCTAEEMIKFLKREP